MSVTLNFSKGSIITNDTTPLVLVHRIQLPILERVGASYDLMVAATNNINAEVEKMNKNEMPCKLLSPKPRRVNDMSSPSAAAGTAVSSPPAATSGSKRPIDHDELASLRAAVGNLANIMNEMLEREAKRQQPPPPLTPPQFMQPPY